MQVTSTVTIRIPALHQNQAAIRKTKVGDRLIFQLVESPFDIRVAVLNGNRDLVGWLPSDDSLVPRLAGGLPYAAVLAKAVQSGKADHFTNLYLEVSTPAGELTA